MHANFYFINQILQLAYTTQACIINLKLKQCKQAHEYAHIKCKQPSSWACSPYLCTSLVQEFFYPTPFCNVAPSLFMSMSKSIFPQYLCTNLSPFVINFHKRCASLDIKGYIGVDGWHLNLAIFYGHHFVCWNDTKYLEGLRYSGFVIDRKFGIKCQTKKEIS